MRLRLLAWAVACVFLFTANALADNYFYNFSLTNGANTITWSLPDDPPGLTINPQGLGIGFFVPGVTLNENGTTFTGTVKFFGSYWSGGGIEICTPDCYTNVVALGFGAVLFSGTTTPEFTYGTYNLTQGDYGSSTVTVSGVTVVTSEPSSMLLLCGGLVLIGFRKRH
jgi:hypothetical protein